MTSKFRPKKGGEVIKLASGSKFVQSSGKLIFDEQEGAWNTIEIKEEILKECSPLPDKEGLPYTMVVPRNRREFKKAIKMAPRGSIPILLYIYKEDKDGS